jgi:hypothetical protein
MPDSDPAWFVHRFYGPPELVEAFREELLDLPDIGSIVPPPDTPFRVLDGAAAISFTSTSSSFPCPEGLFNDRPQTIEALQGYL